MKNKTLVLLGTVGVLLFATMGAQAEEVEVGVTGSIKAGEAAKLLRGEIKQERKILIEGNKATRKTMREENKDIRENLKEENKDEREKFREDVKALLEGKTDEEKAAIMVTIKADRKALFDQNQTQRQEQRKAQWDKRKTMTENIRVNMDSFRASVRTRWIELWASFDKN